MKKQSNEAAMDLVKDIFSDTQIIKADYECWRNPTLSEIKFGEGAIHYRSFPLWDIGYNKKGDLKKWFIAKDDGLRYYRH